MTCFRVLALKHLMLFAAVSGLSNAFTPAVQNKNLFGMTSKLQSAVADEIEKRTGKPIGSSFLPEEAIERAKNGNPIEKMKQKKDFTSVWVDVYDYAAKIRAGETSWEEIDKLDLDNVRKVAIMCCFDSCIEFCPKILTD